MISIHMESDSELIRSFECEETRLSIRNTKSAAIALAIAFPLFFILDMAVYPEHSALFLGLRIVVAAASLSIYGVMHTPLGEKHPRVFGVMQYLSCCLAILVMVAKTGGYASPYYAGINLVLIVLFVILPLDLLSTALVCMFVITGYLGPVFVRGNVTNVVVLLKNNIYLVSTMILVVFSSHVTKKFRLFEYSGRYKLAKSNEELKKLDALKTQFFANISHEVRTPLTSIISPVQCMYHGDAGELSEEQHRLIGQVYRNSLRLLDMINQMLDFSKYEAGKMHLRLALTDPDEIARDTTLLFDEVAARKGLRLQFLSDGRSKPLHLDRNKIERILANLIRNAIKFTDHGSIIVRARREHAELVLEVEDTGIGIPPEHLPHLFERFRQVDGSSIRSYDGTGLGLTLVKEAVDLHRGSISVTSELGVGTRFQVRLPADLEERAGDAFIERRDADRRRGETPYQGPERRRHARRVHDFTGLNIEDIVFMEVPVQDETPRSAAEQDSERSEPRDRVLYIEDNADLRSYISTMLTRMGHLILTAGDGIEGWHMAEEELPDIIVSDVMMPRMDGYELVRRVKNSPKTRHIPVILITDKPGEQARLRGLDQGADEYLSKPVNIRELDARIRNLMTTRRFQHALTRAEELEVRMEELSMSFAQSLEIRNSQIAGHSREVLGLGTLIAEELAVPVDRTLRDSLLLHDIGKLGIPDTVLLKGSSLDNDEWAVMKRHAEIGAELLRRFDSFKDIAEIVYAHQEHVDGSGYPLGLRGDAIPLPARIIAVADAFHAMTHDRPYRRALPRSAAVSELIAQKNRHFDAEIVEALIRGLVRHGSLTESELREARVAAAVVNP